jgi:arylsulfatase A-like enzyme
MPITQVRLTLICSLVCCVLNSTTATIGADKKPNILFIMIDDMGWMDLACQGNKLVETPNIDRLAKQGMRFTDAYAAAPVCSPTRAAVLTGLAPARLRITNHIPDQKRFIPENPKLLPAEMLNYLPLERVTIAERLKQAGYKTGFMGKWHLSGHGRVSSGGIGDGQYAPEFQGFDLNVGGCAYGGPPSFFSPYKIHNLKDGPDGEYLPYRLAQEAIAFIEDNKDGPFLLFLWNYTVHWPMEAPAELLKKYEVHKGKRGLNDTRYGAMIEAMDQSIGQILFKLDVLKLTNDTLVIFTSDNGGFSGVADNRPLRKGKGYLYEGGTRVPLIIRWPGQIKPGTVSTEPVISTDYFATFLEVAGVQPDARQEATDGESLVPLFTGKGLKRDALFWHYPNYAFHRDNRLGSSIRQGDLKLIENLDDGSVELYDVRKDISERHNLAAEQPQVAARLRQRLHAWRKETNAAMPKRP